MSQDIPISYLSKLNFVTSTIPSSGSSSQNFFAGNTVPSSDTTTTTVTQSTLRSSSAVPDCFRTLRCDNCEILFDEAGGEARYTFPCGHVYCAQCTRRARAHAETNDVHVRCHRCGNIIVRRRVNLPCTHQVPAIAFDVRRPPAEFEAAFPDRFRLALGQQTGHRCQMCWLIMRLQYLTVQANQKYDVRPFPGELFACAEVEGRVVHGMRNELPTAVVDVVGDVELKREPDARELGEIASDLCGGLGQVPMEPHFDPRGHIVIKYRLRGWKKWCEVNGVDQLRLPVSLRAAVFGDWM